MSMFVVPMTRSLRPERRRLTSPGVVPRPSGAVGRVAVFTLYKRTNGVMLAARPGNLHARAALPMEGLPGPTPPRMGCAPDRLHRAQRDPRRSPVDGPGSEHRPAERDQGPGGAPPGR